MIKILGVSVFIYVLFLVVLGVLLFIYCSDISVEGFQAGSSGSRMGSGSYMTPPQTYVIDCTVRATPGAAPACLPLTEDTDRLTYLQRLPIGGRLISTNKKYTLMYRPDGVLVFYDLIERKTLWTSDTRGSSGSSVYPAYIWNSGVIDARTSFGVQLPWQPKVLNTAGSSGSAGSAGSSGSSGSARRPVYSIPSSTPDNTIYLKVTSYGDLAIFNAASSLMWTAGIATPPLLSTDCVPQRMSYPFTTDDCYDLNNNIEANKNLIAQLSLPFNGAGSSSGSNGSVPTDLAPPSRSSELNSAKSILCNLTPYYTSLNCASYLATAGSAPKSKWGGKLSSAGGSGIAQPKVAYTGSIQNLSNTATMTGDITQWVKVDDLIYFGYLLDVQGPFVVKALSPPGVNTTITFTKKYIGANLSGAIVSVVSSTPVAITTSATAGSLPNPSANKTIILEDSPQEVYAFGNGTGYTLATAAKACATFGGTVATYNQLVDAHAKGAHWQWYGIVDDSGRARFGFPLQIANPALNYKAGINELTSLTTAGLVCHGVKPPVGTTYNGNPILRFSGPTITSVTGAATFDAAVPVLYNGANAIVGSVMGHTSFINTKNMLLPANLNIGDLVYVEGVCNEFDIDNGDGTCTAFDCRPGEIDLLQNNQCMKYKCNLPPDPSVGIQAAHTLSNGICSAPIEYSNCPPTVSASLNSGEWKDTSKKHGQSPSDVRSLIGSYGTVCTYGEVGIDTTKTESLNPFTAENLPTAEWKTYWLGDYHGHPPGMDGMSVSNRNNLEFLRRTNPALAAALNLNTVDLAQDKMNYSVVMTPKKQAYTYSVTRQGVPDAPYTKTTTNPSYKYPKTLGPYVVASQPSITAIMIKSYIPGDMNANGEIIDISSSSPPSTNIRNKVPALFGLQNARLYKVPYESVLAASGSSGSMVSLTKKVIACSLGAYGNSCSFCAAGQTTLAIGSRTCTACVKNSTSVPGVTANTPLVPGSGGTCTWCKAGKSTKAQVGAPSCSNCDAGYSSNGNGGDCVGCAIGFNSIAGELCTPCRMGQTTTAIGTAICTNCAAGTSTTGTGGSCVPCGAGRVAPEGDPLGCRMCNAGTAAGSDIYTLAAGSPALAQTCSPCRAGYYSSGTGGGCLACNAGYSSTSGDASCSACATNKSSTSGGTCSWCPVGQISNSGGPCYDCPLGKTTNGAGGNCFLCRGGVFDSTNTCTVIGSIVNAEVYHMDQANSYIFKSQAAAQRACMSFGGTLASVTQLTAAIPSGVQWCSTGWVSNDTNQYYPMKQSNASGCGAPGITNYTLAAGGANCFGQKPPSTARYSNAADGVTNAVPWAFYTNRLGSIADIYNSPQTNPITITTRIIEFQTTTSSNTAWVAGFKKIMPIASSLSTLYTVNTSALVNINDGWLAYGYTFNSSDNMMSLDGTPYSGFNQPLRANTYFLLFFKTSEVNTQNNGISIVTPSETVPLISQVCTAGVCMPAGLQLWFDGNDPSANGSAPGSITQWKDKSANRLTAQMSSGAALTVVGGIVGTLSAVQFQASRPDWGVVSFSPGLFNTAAQVFVVSRNLSGTNPVSGFANNRTPFSFGEKSFFDPWDWTRCVANHAVNITSPRSIESAEINIWCGLVYQASASTSYYKEWVNGAPITGFTGNPSTGFAQDTQSTKFYIGGRDTTASAKDIKWDGYIFEIAVYNTALSDSDRQKVEGYLAWKWGVNPSLPTTHPNFPSRSYLTTLA